MFCTAEMAETVIGKTLARKMRKIGAASLMPNQMMATGIHAMGEIGPEDLQQRIEGAKGARIPPEAKPRRHADEHGQRRSPR